MAVIDDILTPMSEASVYAVRSLVAAIDEWNALDPGSRPTLAAHLGLTDAEYVSWGGPGTRVVNRVTQTTLGNAAALQAIILARVP